MELSKLTIEEYSSLLEAKKSVPGGGSALSLVLELALDLVLMTCNFTIDKIGYESVQEEIIEIKNKLLVLKQKAHLLIDEDGKAYQQVMDAFRSKDKLKISESSLYACEVPYQLFSLAKMCESLGLRVTEIGNKNLVSDAYIGIDLCKSIYPGCIANIKCNIDNIIDEEKKIKYLEIIK